jgi:hypothetical protein
MIRLDADETAPVGPVDPVAPRSPAKLNVQLANVPLPPARSEVKTSVVDE